MDRRKEKRREEKDALKHKLRLQIKHSDIHRQIEFCKAKQSDAMQFMQVKGRV